jgi:hypothetical protein
MYTCSNQKDSIFKKKIIFKIIFILKYYNIIRPFLKRIPAVIKRFFGN